jgi:protoporphyrinogen oxidase
MKNKLKTKVKQLAEKPAAKEAVKSLKPAKTIWGFLGVVLFFIAPEIIAFVWGTEITAYAHEHLASSSSTAASYYYEGLVMLFEDGGSWINLFIGFALLVWLFY